MDRQNLRPRTFTVTQVLPKSVSRLRIASPVRAAFLIASSAAATFLVNLPSLSAFRREYLTAQLAPGVGLRVQVHVPIACGELQCLLGR